MTFHSSFCVTKVKERWQFKMKSAQETSICPCAIGHGDTKEADQKREGDGATPLGYWPFLWVYYRPDRLSPPQTALPVVPLARHDGWCDAPAHKLYNEPISLPFSASHEQLWREDHIYDVIIVLKHNFRPAIAGKGSAIFLHLARHDYKPTEGCVALKLEHMLAFLRHAAPRDGLEIR